LERQKQIEEDIRNNERIEIQCAKVAEKASTVRRSSFEASQQKAKNADQKQIAADEAQIKCYDVRSLYLIYYHFC